MIGLSNYLLVQCCIRFGEHKGSYCTLASFDQDSEVKVFLENCPLEVKPEELGVEVMESPPSPHSTDESDTPSSPVDEQPNPKESKTKVYYKGKDDLYYVQYSFTNRIAFPGYYSNFNKQCSTNLSP